MDKKDLKSMYRASALDSYATVDVETKTSEQNPHHLVTLLFEKGCVLLRQSEEQLKRDDQEGFYHCFGCGESGVNVHSSETDSVEVWHADTNTWTNMKLSQARKKCSATSVVLSRTKDKDSNNVLEGKILHSS